MTLELKSDLKMHETDVEQVIYRFVGNEDLYEGCLIKFLQDPSMGDLEEALKYKNWDDAFTAAHALKGLAGNMGFNPLFYASAEMVICIRQRRIEDIDSVFYEMKRCYEEITHVIKEHCMTKGDIR